MLNNEIEYFPEAAMFHGHIPLIMGTKLDLIAIGASKENSSRIWDWLCFEAYHLEKCPELTKLKSCRTPQ